MGTDPVGHSFCPKTRGETRGKAVRMGETVKRKRRMPLSRVSVFHYVKLVYRSLLLAAVTVYYIVKRVSRVDEFVETLANSPVVMAVLGSVFAVEMVFRMFPSRLESMGCEKQFKRFYKPTGEEKPRLQSAWVTFSVFAVWVLLNAVFGTLYLTGVFDQWIMIIISLVYSVCDMCCILFFCPFQTWFMKNKCCTTCRIYNWDYAMMFTPLAFVRGVFTWSLFGMALLLLLLWEVRLRRAPERFSECTNASLACVNCREKLCHHKKQLRRFLRKQQMFLKEQTEKLRDTIRRGKNDDGDGPADPPTDGQT